MSETLPDYQRFRAPSRRVTVALFGHWLWQLDEGAGHWTMALVVPVPVPVSPRLHLLSSCCCWAPCACPSPPNPPSPVISHLCPSKPTAHCPPLLSTRAADAPFRQTEPSPRSLVGLTPGNLVVSLNILPSPAPLGDRCPFSAHLLFCPRPEPTIHSFPPTATCLSLSTKCSFVTLDLDMPRTIFRQNNYLFWVRHLAARPERECSRENNSG